MIFIFEQLKAAKYRRNARSVIERGAADSAAEQLFRGAVDGDTHTGAHDLFDLVCGHADIYRKVFNLFRFFVIVARGEMRRSRSYNAEKRLVTPHRHLLRSENSRIYSADALEFYKSAVVDSGNGHSNSVYMSVEHDMHPVAARISAHAAERVNMRGHILFEH